MLLSKLFPPSAVFHVPESAVTSFKLFTVSIFKSSQPPPNTHNSIWGCWKTSPHSHPHKNQTTLWTMEWLQPQNPIRVLWLRDRNLYLCVEATVNVTLFHFRKNFVFASSRRNGETAEGDRKRERYTLKSWTNNTISVYSGKNGGRHSSSSNSTQQQTHTHFMRSTMPTCWYVFVGNHLNSTNLLGSISSDFEAFCILYIVVNIFVHF